jgi:hypothetical protein
MKVYILMSGQNADGGKCWEKNLADRLIFLKVQMCAMTKFAEYHNENGKRWLTQVDEDVINNVSDKIILDHCSSWKEVEKYLI